MHKPHSADNTKRARLWCLTLASATALWWGGATGNAIAGDTSDESLVFVNAGASYFWHTATNNVLALPIVFPNGATSASLAVTGLRYSFNDTITEEGDYLLEIPQATSPQTENVYSLTLTFDDEAETVQTATLGLVTSYGANGGGSTCVLVPNGTARWGKVEQRAVMPIPYGATSLTVSGVASDTGLGGDAGWYALAVSAGSSQILAMTDAVGTVWTTTLTGIAPTVMVFK